MAFLDKMRGMIAPKVEPELNDFASESNEAEYSQNRARNLRLVDRGSNRSDEHNSDQESYEESARLTYSAPISGKVHTRGAKGATVYARDDLSLEPASQYSVSESVSLVNLSDIRALQSRIHEDNAANINSSASNHTDGHAFDANMTAEFDKVISIDPLIDDGTPRRVQIISPRRFNDMSALAQALKSNKIVVLKIARLDHQLAVRLLDFAFGATAALSGHTQKNEHNEFIFYLGSKITPDEQAALAEKGIALV